MNVDDSILPGDIRMHLCTRAFGRRIYYLPEVGSTNDFAIRLAKSGEVEGTLVLSDFQKAGRGRLKRKWNSPAGKNLLFSLILRPDIESRSVLPLTLALSLALADALESILGIRVQVKWPNDVVVSGKKLCGILAEGSSKGSRSTYAVVGVGLNVNVRENDFPAAIRKNSASCRTVTGKEYPRQVVLSELLAFLERDYERFSAEGFAPFAEPYEGKLSILGTDVSFEKGGRELRGRVVGLERDGALVVSVAGEGDVVLYNEVLTSI